MKQSEISRLRNLHHDNKVVLQLLSEIEILVRTNSLLQSRINELKAEPPRPMPTVPKLSGNWFDRPSD